MKNKVNRDDGSIVAATIFVLSPPLLLEFQTQTQPQDRAAVSLLWCLRGLCRDCVTISVTEWLARLP